jgi:preprotein translocase subunit SecB
VTHPQARIGPTIRIGQILLERAEFEHREDYLDLPPTTPAGAEGVRIEVQSALSDDRSRAVTKLRAHTQAVENPVYRFDVVFAVIAEIDPLPASLTVDRYIVGSTVGFLAPFLREMVANLTLRGRFGPVWLQPVNPREIAAQIQPMAATPERGTHPESSAKPVKKRSTKKASSRKKAS